MYWYKHDLEAYDRDTAHLSLTEDGAYSRLLRRFYASEQPLPADKDSLYRMTRAIERWEREAVDSVLAKFFQLTPNGYVQARAERELAKYKKAATAHMANLGANLDSQNAPENLRIKESKNNTKPKSLGAKAAPKRATPFQKDFSLTEGLHQYASDRGVVDVVAEFEKFREHHIARGTLFKDWEAAWRTWVLRSAQYAKVRPDGRESACRRETSVGLGPEVHRPLPQVHAPVQPDLLRAVSTVAAKKGF